MNYILSSTRFQTLILGFVMGIISYAKRKPERLDKVLRYLNEAPNPTSSDVVKFVMEQPDFHEYGLELKEMTD